MSRQERFPRNKYKLLHALIRSPSPASLLAPFRSWIATIRSPWSLLWAEVTPLSQPVLTGEVLQTSDHLCGPPLDPLQQLYVLFVFRAPDLDAVLHLESLKSRVKGQNHLPQSAGHASLDATQDRVAGVPGGIQETFRCCTEGHGLVEKYGEIVVGGYLDWIILEVFSNPLSFHHIQLSS